MILPMSPALDLELIIKEMFRTYNKEMFIFRHLFVILTTLRLKTFTSLRMFTCDI